MTDPSSYPDPGVGSDPDSNTGIPRWVQVVGIIVAIVVLLVVVVVLVGGHTPPPGIH